MKTRRIATILAFTGILIGGAFVTGEALAQRGEGRRDRDPAAAWEARPGKGQDFDRDRGPGNQWRPERPFFGDGPEGKPGFGPHRPGGPGGPDAPGAPVAPGGPGGPGFGSPLDGAMRKAQGIMMPFWENEDVADELGLTADQVDALATSHALTKEQLDATDGSIRDAAEALRDAMEVDNPEISEVNEAIDEVTAATNEKAKIVLGHAVVVKNVLTVEQLEELPGLMRDQGREIRELMRELMQDIRETVKNGGTYDDVVVLIETSELPDHAKERALKIAERLKDRLENRPNRKGESER